MHLSPKLQGVHLTIMMEVVCRASQVTTVGLEPPSHRSELPLVLTKMPLPHHVSLVT